MNLKTLAIGIGALMLLCIFSTGCIEEVKENKPPRAEINRRMPSTVYIGEEIQFDGSNSSDPDGTIVSYDWDFGDGSPHGSGEFVTHVYNEEGDYRVILTVKDNEGAIDTDSIMINVINISEYIEPSINVFSIIGMTDEASTIYLLSLSVSLASGSPDIDLAELVVDVLTETNEDKDVKHKIDVIYGDDDLILEKMETYKISLSDYTDPDGGTTDLTNIGTNEEVTVKLYGTGMSEVTVTFTTPSEMSPNEYYELYG
jgi:PKD repeat protein